MRLKWRGRPVIMLSKSSKCCADTTEWLKLVGSGKRKPPHSAIIQTALQISPITPLCQQFMGIIILIRASPNISREIQNSHSTYRKCMYPIWRYLGQQDMVLPWTVTKKSILVKHWEKYRSDLWTVTETWVPPWVTENIPSFWVEIEHTLGIFWTALILLRPGS